MSTQLSGLDALMYYQESAQAPNHLGPLEVYDTTSAVGGRLDFEAFRAHVEPRIAALPELHRRLQRVPLGLDRPYWVTDGDVDLDAHLHNTALPAPGGWQELCTQVTRIHSRPLDLSRPPWELWFIEGVDSVDGCPPGGVAVYLKIHHAALDGVAGARLVTALHDDTADAHLAPGGEAGSPVAVQAMPGPARLLTTAALHAAQTPAGLLRLGAPLLRQHLPALPGRLPRLAAAVPSAVGALPGQLRRPRLPGAPPTRFSGKVSAHRVFDAVRIPMSDLRAARLLAPGSTVNDVCLAVVGGALRDYLEDKGELPADSLNAIMPISVRSDGAGVGNQITMVPVTLATDLSEPAERLAAVRDATRRAKGMSDALGAGALMELSQAVPGALLALGVRTTHLFSAVVGNVASTTVTNVPGPPTPMYLAGARSVLQTGLVPVLHGMGLFHAMTSYCGEAKLAYTACAEMLPDPDVYTACLQRSVAALATAQ